MRSRAAALAGRLARHHAADAALFARPSASAAEGWVGLLAARLASSAAAGPLTLPGPPPAWRAQAQSWPTSRGYASSSSTSAAEAAASPSPPPALTLTPAAAAKIRELLARPPAVEAGHTALRLTVEAGGCSGFSYVFTLDGGPQKGDTAVAEDGSPAALLIIDPVSLELVRGGTVDFVSELIKSGFEVTANPNADAGCGCGASFTPKL